MVCSLALQHSDWIKSKQGREQQQQQHRVLQRTGRSKRMLQKVEGDEGVFGEPFKLLCEQEWEERAEEELQRLSSCKHAEKIKE